MAKKLPISIETWENHLRWAQRAGNYPGWGVGRLVFTALLYALGASALLLVNPAPISLFAPVLGFTYPTAYLVDISYISGLNQIKYDDEKDVLTIGALCTHSDIESSSVIQKKFNILAQACHSIGSVQIRNLGTIGGNLCNASPSADSASALLALDAKVRIFGPAGEDAVELVKFFTGTGETIIKHDEILAGIDISATSPHSSGVYLKLSPRRAMDLAVVGVGIVMWSSADGSTSRTYASHLARFPPYLFGHLRRKKSFEGRNLIMPLSMKQPEWLQRKQNP